MTLQKRKNHFRGVKVSGTKQHTEKGKILKAKELSLKKHPMVKEKRASLKVGAQLDKLNQVVMVVLMGNGESDKGKKPPRKGKDHQMGLEK